MNNQSRTSTLPNEPIRFLSRALGHARTANEHANLGYRYKRRFEHFDAILKKWEELLANSHAVPHSLLFLLFFFVDILVSWQMNLDIIAEAGFFPGDYPPAWAVLLLCLLINGWAAVSANFFAKGWSRDVQALERWNTFYFKTSQNTPIVDEQEDDMEYERRKARRYAIISSTVLFVIVLLIVWHRWLLLQPDPSAEGSEAAANIGALNSIIIFLPLAVLFGEILTGDYVWYLFQRGIFTWKRWRNWRKFRSHKRQCEAADHRAFENFHIAREQNNDSKDIGEALEKSLYRIRHRAPDKDDYIDPVEEAHRISFTIVYRANGLPLRRVQVFGVLPSGAKTGDFQTDEHGRVMLSWTGNFDRLELITINQQRSEAGPFHENAEHLVRANIAPPGSNGTPPPDNGGPALATAPLPPNGTGAELIAGG